MAHDVAPTTVTISAAARRNAFMMVSSAVPRSLASTLMRRSSFCVYEREPISTDGMAAEKAVLARQRPRCTPYTATNKCNFFREVGNIFDRTVIAAVPLDRNVA